MKVVQKVAALAGLWAVESAGVKAAQSAEWLAVQTAAVKADRWVGHWAVRKVAQRVALMAASKA